MAYPFEGQLRQERRASINGKRPQMIRIEHMHEFDIYCSRQPRRIGPNLF